jgi:hypothetical protein
MVDDDRVFDDEGKGRLKEGNRQEIGEYCERLEWEGSEGWPAGKDIVEDIYALECLATRRSGTGRNGYGSPLPGAMQAKGKGGIECLPSGVCVRL